MKISPPTHREEILRLKRIEGQVRGVQRMIEDGRYCMDILTVLASIAAALERVEDSILARHLRTCVRQSMTAGSAADKDRKIDEVVDLLGKFRKH
jgi:DNA-binding FrmR family transcriptional regulator